MRFQYLYWTIALVSTLVQAQRCAPPTWNEYNPSDGIISSEQRFTASGTSARNPIDFGCNTIYLLVNGTYLYSTFATSSGGTFGPPRQWNFNQFTLSNGGQIPFGQATLQIYAGSGNIASTTQTRTIFIYPYCPSATLTNPSSGGKVTTRTPILYGKSPDPFCRDIQLLLDFPNGVRQTYTTTADSSGNFQIQVNTALSDGTYFATYYGGAKFRTYGYVSSSFYLNLDACRAPTITKPANLEIVQVRRPTIEGTRQGYQEDCTSVDIFVDNARVQQNVPLTYVNNQPYYRFSRQLTTSLQPGVHTVYATVVGTNNRPNSGNSPTISFTVSNDAPSTGPNSRRRSFACPFGAEVCIAYDVKGRKVYECVYDLDTDLERCGACDGPDCSDIPNVLDVACEQGECIVSSCTDGYSVVNNTCTAESASLGAGMFFQDS